MTLVKDYVDSRKDELFTEAADDLLDSLDKEINKVRLALALARPADVIPS